MHDTSELAVAKVGISLEVRVAVGPVVGVDDVDDGWEAELKVGSDVGDPVGTLDLLWEATLVTGRVCR